MSDWKLTIRQSNGDRFEISIASTANVQQCKSTIARDKAEFEVHRQRLVYKGRILEDDRALVDYGIVDKATLFLVMSSAAKTTTAGGGSGIATTTTSAATASGPSPVSVPFPFVSNPSSSSSNSSQQQPFGAMPGMFGAGAGGANAGAGIPGLGGAMDPNQIRQMMNSPMMQGLMDNPELMRSLMQTSMQQNPQLRTMMENNPEMRNLMNDPAMLDQAIRMMRDPSAMQQAMRQQELAMSQLENLPGGFSALSSMYRNIQEPLMDMDAGSTPSNANSGSNAANRTAGASGASMPNPWSSSPTPAPSPAPNAGSGATNPWGAMANPWAAAGSGGAGVAPSDAPGGIPNMGAMGLGGMGGMPPNPQDMEQMIQMLENPMVRTMMEQMMQSNPGLIRGMIEQQNPMMRQLFESNPQLAEQLTRQMMDPQALRQMVQLQRQMQSGGGIPGFGMAPPAMGSVPQAGLDLSSLFGGGSGSTASPSQHPPALDFSNLMQQFQGLQTGSQSQVNTHPADRFRSQLQSLRDMGFDDEQASLAALQANHGNLNRAVDQLLLGEPSAPSSAPAPSAETAVQPPAPAQQPPSDEAAHEPKDSNEKKND